MLPVLLWLGTWQVHRLHWKRELLATISERAHDAPMDVPLPAGLDADYRPAKVVGTFRHDLQFFVLATDLTTGKGGYHVLTPLQLAGGQYLIVDRGWIPYESRQREDSFPKPMGKIDLRGILTVPRMAGLFMPKNDPVKSEWYSVDLAAMASVDRLDGFLPYVLEVSRAESAQTLPIGGQTRLTLPNDHFSYAVTWYSFAVILLIIYFLSSYRRKNED